jgi:hypothetical protein
MVRPVLASNAVGAAFGILELIVIASWALMFAVFIAMLVTVTLMRGRRARKRQEAPPAAAADPNLPARLAELRRGDPHFDEQLLSEAAQMACLLMFATLTMGDEQPIRHLAAPSFWLTFFGKYLKMSARDARRQRATPIDKDRPSSRRLRLPVDYQASAPELISIELGQQQRACVRVTFNQLRAIVAPGAAGQVAMASATSLGSLAASFGGVVGEHATRTSEVSWLSWAGQYDLAFTRPGGSATDPSAALASRTCARCGATYRSEFTTACEHCGAQRPLAWGQWQLTSITTVDS